MPKNSYLKVRLSKDEKDQLEQLAKDYGYVKNSGDGDQSKYVRAKLFSDTMQPMHREGYQYLVQNIQNLNRLGGLINQYMYHTNKERLILREKDLDHENNRGFLKTLDKKNDQLLALHSEIKSLKNTLKTIVEMHSA